MPVLPTNVISVAVGTRVNVWAQAHGGVWLIYTSVPTRTLSTKKVMTFISSIFLDSVLRFFLYYFSSYETSQSVGEAKTGESREKPHDTPASRTWLVSHFAQCGT